MLKVAILDDYQNVAQQFVDLEKLSGKYEFKIFSEKFMFYHILGASFIIIGILLSNKKVKNA